ncbi:COG1470 family protein [Mycolicibacterium monacense]|uniref:Uncharacterized protein n=1 Tax=Mycolicibacterium monacense TaxID=85693 RepID=A0AAD1IYG9_MYCMB|nr:hypothetical protein [Mycolicibacterium monacense]MDA4100494.1 hypothetical protein [Mycolicibacterium monacense DSM 44395]ORB21434.1 hypothetical protein BST34_10120 [Mycolicibacterium monacense DSM 44395]QHP84753.1 hypothetical protein EWR22_04895 [Mycolicibacterium monacense DSM 44395]BBZ62443.1 hypothetical protein MMON_37440 [Mycolicibacterium monacense]
MADQKCKECGTLNAADVRFCKSCDAFLDPQPAPEPGPVQPSPDDNRAQPPQVELATTEASVSPDTAGAVEIRIRNGSTIVDAYRVDPVDPPEWLVVEQPEIRLMPGENKSVKVTFSMRAGSFVEAQTVKVPLRICSLRDLAKFAETQVALVVPPSGPKVSITARPTVVSVEDETSGKFQIILDNRASNHARRVVLSGTDPEATVLFHFVSPTEEVAAGKSSTVEVRFDVPPLDEGERRTRQLTVTATDGDESDSAVVTVEQEQSATLPLKLRLQPSKLRVEDCPVADLTLLIDNSDGKHDRAVRLEGRDPENAIRFTFPTPEVEVKAGKVATLRFSVSAKQPPAGEQTLRDFTVVAAEGTRESETGGTFTQVTSQPPILTAELRLHPETLRRRDRTNGTYQVTLENHDRSQWLQANLFAWDQERMMRFSFAPDRFDIPPGGSTAAWLSVSAPKPPRGKEVTRTFQVEASDGVESVTRNGTLVQSGSNWIPIVRAVLTLLGGIAVAVGTFTPWMINLPDYWITELPRIGSATDDVERTQPAIRAAILFMAVMMTIGLAGRGGKATVSAAVLIATTLIGYFVYVSSQVSTGGPMYGAYLIGAGALIGAAGGLLGRL